MNLLFYSVFVIYLVSTAVYSAYLFFQIDRLQNVGRYLIFSGFFIHSIAIGYGLITTRQFPVNNLHEVLSLAVWALAGAYLFFRYRYGLKVLGIYAAPLITIVLAVSLLLPREPAQTKIVLNNFWIVLHVAVVIIGESAFAMAFGIGILYLLQERAIKSKHHGFFYRRLPSLELLDQTGYACIVIGFTLMTIGLIVGFIYAHSVWGRFWSWDPKEVFSGITWLVYAALIHGRLAVGWRGRQAAVMSIIGFSVVLFTFVGVNFLFQGHHGEFTQW